MNINFHKIKKGVSDTANKVKEVSCNMVEVTKMKFKLSELKSEIDACYMQIGKLVYEGDDEADTEQIITSICEKISELKDKSNILKSSIDEAMDKKTCAQCGFKYDKSYDFCPKCGKCFNE